MLNSTPVASDSASVNQSRLRIERWRFGVSGKAGRHELGEQRSIPARRDTHAEHAADQRKQAPSVIICRISRPRPAPSAARTAISRCRATPRASSRLGEIGAGDQQDAAGRAHQHQDAEARIAEQSSRSGTTTAPTFAF